MHFENLGLKVRLDQRPAQDRIGLSFYPKSLDGGNCVGIGGADGAAVFGPSLATFAAGREDPAWTLPVIRSIRLL